MTYCLMGNGLTIMADEEYLTISSTLEPPHSLPTSLASHNLTTNLHSQASSSSSSSTSQNQNPGLGPHIPTTTVSPLSLSSDTPTTCSLAHPARPLTTQPPKAKHHPVQQGLLPGHYKVVSKNGRPTVPPPRPPPPPLTPITAQVISSMPPRALTLPPTVLPTPAQSHVHLREEIETKNKEYKDDDDEKDEDDEEEESRRKASGSSCAKQPVTLNAMFAHWC